MDEVFQDLSDVIGECAEIGGVVFQTSVVGGNFVGVLNLERSNLSMQVAGTHEATQALLVAGKTQFGGSALAYPMSVTINDVSWTVTDLDEDDGSYRLTINRDNVKGFTF